MLQQKAVSDLINLEYVIEYLCVEREQLQNFACAILLRNNTDIRKNERVCIFTNSKQFVIQHIFYIKTFLGRLWLILCAKWKLYELLKTNSFNSNYYPLNVQ